MQRKLLLLVLALAATTALVPTAASANWKDKGVELKAGENPAVTGEGSFSFTGSLGTVKCESGAKLTAQLTGGTTEGHVSSFAISEPSKCAVSGLLGAACGAKSLTATTWTVSVGFVWWRITPFFIDWGFFGMHFHFGTCATLKLSGTITATPDSTTEMKSLTLSGTLLGTPPGSNVTISGKLTLSPAGTYGL